jgi:hypothetical protein
LLIKELKNCCLVSVGRPLWREDGSSIYSVITEAVNCTHEAEWTSFQTQYVFFPSFRLPKAFPSHWKMVQSEIYDVQKDICSIETKDKRRYLSKRFAARMSSGRSDKLLYWSNYSLECVGQFQWTHSLTFFTPKW